MGACLADQFELEHDAVDDARSRIDCLAVAGSQSSLRPLISRCVGIRRFRDPHRNSNVLRWGSIGDRRQPTTGFSARHAK